MRLRGTLWITDDLRDAVAVADIKEDEAAMIAASIDPTRQGHVLPDVLCI